MTVCGMISFGFDKIALPLFVQTFLGIEALP